MHTASAGTAHPVATGGPNLEFASVDVVLYWIGIRSEDRGGLNGYAEVRREYHPEEVWETGDDHENAYALGNSRFTRGDLRNHYSSRRELTDTIQRAIRDAGAFGCTRDCPNAPGGLSVDE